MFFAPIIGMVPPEATAPALIIVGFLMMTALTEAEEVAETEQIAEREGGPPPPVRQPRKLAGIDFSDLAIGLGAALTIMVMPFTFSIADGIGFGFIAYVVICLARGEWRRVHPFMYVAAGAFALYFLVPLLQDHLSWI
jgi:adenine/guanine/hypoxanthine permease